MTCKLTVQNRIAKVSVVPSAAALVIKALKEPTRDRKKARALCSRGKGESLRVSALRGVREGCHGACFCVCLKAGSPFQEAPLDSTCRWHCLCACMLQAFRPGCMYCARRLCRRCPAEQMRALSPASSTGCVCACKKGSLMKIGTRVCRQTGAACAAGTAEVAAGLSGRRGGRAPPRMRADRAARPGGGQCALLPDA